MESFMENLPLILAIALAISEAMALIPAFKENSILQLAMKLLRKAKEMFPQKKEAEKLGEEKKEEDAE